MTQPPQIHEFDPQIYPFKLWVAITNDLTVITDQFDDYPSGDNFDPTDSEKNDRIHTKRSAKIRWIYRLNNRFQE